MPFRIAPLLLALSCIALPGLATAAGSDTKAPAHGSKASGSGKAVVTGKSGQSTKPGKTAPATKTPVKAGTKAASTKTPPKAPARSVPKAAATTSSASGNPERQAESSKADLQELHGRIDSLRKEVAGAEESRADVADQLKDAEKGISTLSRDLRQLSSQRGDLQETLRALSNQSRDLEATLAGQRSQLEQVLVRQYMQGGDSADSLRLMLNGNDPNQTARDLYYLGAIARARSSLLQQVATTLKQKKALMADTKDREEELAAVENKQKEQHAQLLEQKQQRQATLAKISQQIEARRRELGALQQDEKRLTKLIDGLSRIIAQQKAKPRPTPPAPAATPAPRPHHGERPERTEPPRTTTPGIDNNKTPETSTAYSGGDFSRLRGNLRLPVKGTVTNRFGSQRQEGNTWKGLFIRAASGGEVHAIAPGRVVFADWMRGFGNLLIVDHGDGYLTIYGNNESLYKQAGENVKSGEVVAVIGNSGGNPESGLYFELRHQGQPLDPLKWVSLR